MLAPRRSLPLLLCWLALPACAHRPLDVSLRAAVVGPADWDGLDATVPVVQDALISAFAEENPLAAAVGSAALGLLARGRAAPDVRGEFWLSVDGQREGPPARLPVVQDSFTPVWRDATLRGVRLRGGAVLLVALWDADAFNRDDLIAQVPVYPRQIRRAARAGEPLWIDTQAQTGGQLLRLALEVAPTAAGRATPGPAAQRRRRP